MSKKSIIVYTDGSCSGNGKKNSNGGIGIHFPNGELKDVSKIYRHGDCTNQKTELYAILTAIRYIKQNYNIVNRKIIIKTDSEYSINCITKWVNGWIKNGWKTKSNTPVLNREFIEPIHKYYERYDIEMIHVDAHTGNTDVDSIGNAKADQLATKATKRSIDEKRSANPNNKSNIRKPSTSKSARKSSRKPVISNKSYYNGILKNEKFIVELIKAKN